MVNTNAAAAEWFSMSIPGSDDGTIPCAWFAFNGKTRRCVRATDRLDANRKAAALNAKVSR